MSAQKFFAVLACAISVAIAINFVHCADASPYAAPKNLSHDLILGYRLPGDRLILRESVVKASSWMRIVTVEKTFSAPLYNVITEVKALDQKTNGNGAYASVTGGGPGYNNVNIRLKSQRGHGINFVVEVYARP